MQAVRDAGITVISGFHAPMDRECLRILLRGKQPIIVCPARSLEKLRFPANWREPIEAGRMLILSPSREGAPHFEGSRRGPQSVRCRFGGRCSAHSCRPGQ